MVTIFGGSHLQKHTFYFSKAYELAALFVQHDISRLTGGGPGAMEAANCGAFAQKHDGTVKSIGIGVEGLNEKPAINVPKNILCFTTFLPANGL